MFVSVRVRTSAVLAMSILVGSCGSLGPVRGIPPTLQVNEVERASGNTKRILLALAADTGLQGPRGDMWYLVSQAGFNYIDDRCSEYFYSLFRLNRRREALKSSFSAFGQTTNAILEATGATTVSMAVVAQAFGLATTMTDIVSGTFLYELPPATTREFVSKLQRAYREGAAEDKAAINTPTAAYHVIQEYLALCLPPTIEARIAGHVANPGAIPEIRPGAGIEVLVGTQNPAVAQALTRTRSPLRGSARTPTSPPQRVRPEASGWDVANATGQPIYLSTAKAIQRALCLPADGTYGPRTAEGLQIFESVIARKFVNEQWQDMDVSLSFRDLNELRRQPPCPQGAKNFLERRLVDKGSIPRIGKQIAEKYPGAPANGGLVRLRPFIEEWRTELGLRSGPSGALVDQLTPDFLALSGITP